MADVCICELNQDGHCSPCQTKIGDGIQNFMKLFHEYQVQVQEAVSVFAGGDKCSECARRYTDWAMANVLKEFAKADSPKEFFGASFNSMSRMFMGLGVTAFPLSLKAYKETCWVKGWDENEIFSQS